MILRKDLIVILIDTHYKKSDNSSIDMVRDALKEIFNDKTILPYNTELLLTQSNTDSLSLESDDKKQLLIKIKDIKKYQFNDRKITTEETEGLGYITQNIFSEIEKWKKIKLRRFSKISFILISNWDTNGIQPKDRDTYENWEEKIHSNKNVDFTLIGIKGGDFEQLVKNHDNIQALKVSKNNMKEEILKVFSSHKITRKKIWTWIKRKWKLLTTIAFLLISISISFISNKLNEINGIKMNFESIYKKEVNNYNNYIIKTLNVDTTTYKLPDFEPLTFNWRGNKITQEVIFYVDTKYSPLEDTLLNFKSGSYFIKNDDNRLFKTSKAYQEIVLKSILNKIKNPIKVQVEITGETDIIFEKKPLYYGEYGNISDSFYLDGEAKQYISLHENNDSIESNLELGYLRAKSFWAFLRIQEDYFLNHKTTYKYYSIENQKSGKEYRRVIFKITIHS